MESKSTTHWLTIEQQRSWRSFLGGTTVLMERLDRDLRTKHGLSLPEYEILVRLSEAPDRSLRMADLAEAVAQSRSRVTHTVSRLERAELVSRAQFSDDGRGVSAVLSEHGLSVLTLAAQTHVAGVNSYLIENAAPGDFEAVGRVMQSVVETLGGRRF